MSKSNFIEINGEKIEIIYNLIAMKKIGKISGKSDINQWFEELIDRGDEKTTVKDICELCSRICITVTEMANAAIAKNNFEIEMGLRTEQKKSLYPAEYFNSVICIGDAMELFESVIKTISAGMSIEIPESLKEDIDVDLIEIKAEKKS